jgi:hypothetical protein
MGKDSFDINALGLKSSVGIAVTCLIAAILVDSHLLPDRGRIFFFSAVMCCIAIYTSAPVIKYIGAEIFLSFYIMIHVSLIALPFTRDSSYPGPILFPIAIADYVSMVFILRLCTLALMK